MLHLGAVLPNLTFAADAHYHHLLDDVIEGGKLPYENGAIRVPDGPGLGVRLDRDRLARYAELYRELGGYPYDRDPAAPAGSRSSRTPAGAIPRRRGRAREAPPADRGRAVVPRPRADGRAGRRRGGDDHRPRARRRRAADREEN